MRSRAMIALTCATLLTVAGCSGGTFAGEPATPKPDLKSARPDGLPKYGAPAVPKPLDVNGIVNDPCKAPTKQQISTFPGSLAETQVSKSTLTGDAKACGWIFRGKRYSLGSITGGIILPSATHQGLSSLYKAKQDGVVNKLWQVGPIAGYPAVVHTIDRTIGDGYCRLSVGVRDDTIYQINTALSSNHPAEQNPCRVAKKFAQFLVENLKYGQ